MARDLVVPALARSAAVQRRAARRISQVYVRYPSGPQAVPGQPAGRPAGRRGPAVGQRMPDLAVRADGRATTLHQALGGGRHVLLIPAASAAAVRADAALRPYRDDVELVETAGAGPAVLVRPDGHVAAKGGPGRMPAISGYLRGLFGEPGSVPAAGPVGALSQPAASQPAAVTRGQ